METPMSPFDMVLAQNELRMHSLPLFLGVAVQMLILDYQHFTPYSML